MAGIYIHIPFCKQKCIYCDFYSNTSTYYQETVDLLCKELEQRKDYLQAAPVKTVYMGGGTPSLLSPELLAQIYRTIAHNYDLSMCEEFTIEANPDDLSEEYLQSLCRQVPLNRISMGIQSFNDEELLFLCRRHSARQAEEAVQRCRKAGITNISIDLMYGLPIQTLDGWHANIEKAIALNVPHISAYHLSVEAGTALALKIKKGELCEIDEDKSTAMYRLLVRKMKEAGYTHYEISNFAIDPHYSKHNTSYWQNIPYLGIGPGAHSYNRHSRQWNIASLYKWMDTVNGKANHVETETLTTDMKYNEYIMTRLRTIWGISFEEVNTEFGGKYHRHLVKQSLPYRRNRLLLPAPDDRLCLSEEALFISDRIIGDLII